MPVRRDESRLGLPMPLRHTANFGRFALKHGSDDVWKPSARLQARSDVGQSQAQLQSQVLAKSSLFAARLAAVIPAGRTVVLDPKLSTLHETGVSPLSPLAGYQSGPASEPQFARAAAAGARTLRNALVSTERSSRLTRFG
jgi:hypothetical protein